MYASSVAEWRYGVRCAPCGVWTVRACGAGAGERAESSRERQHRRWYCTAEHLGRGGSRHFRRHRGFIPRGLFVYVATRHRLPTHPRCLPSICPSKKENFAEQRQRREVYRTPYWGERKKSFGQPAVNEVNTLLKEKSQKVGMSQQEQSLVSIR